jgi:hypothetical protein
MPCEYPALSKQEGYALVRAGVALFSPSHSLRRTQSGHFQSQNVGLLLCCGISLEQFQKVTQVSIFLAPWNDPLLTTLEAGNWHLYFRLQGSYRFAVALWAFKFKGANVSGFYSSASLDGHEVRQ